MSASNSQFVGWATIIGGVVGVIGFISLILLFVVGEPFGTINDILTIPTAFLMMPLVLALYRLNSAGYPLVSLSALLVGVIGFFATAVGSILLVTGRIDFQQSLITGIGGFGLIGLWVLINSIMGLRDGALPRTIAWAGILLAITPSISLLAMLRLESIANGLTGMAGQTSGFQMSVPVMVIFLLGFISYAGMPIWFILIGRLFLTNRLDLPAGAIVAS